MTTMCMACEPFYEPVFIGDSSVHPPKLYRGVKLCPRHEQTTDAAQQKIEELERHTETVKRVTNRVVAGHQQRITQLEELSTEYVRLIEMWRDDLSSVNDGQVDGDPHTTVKLIVNSMTKKLEMFNPRSDEQTQIG